ncbi:uncharacterized protein LOC111043186 [Myzus persicae]|uniref:uncharacterized protein LOC111043186 n=1 Tax=Myzus persicae TaxID=13164 RepID=UPI000B9346DA|nr:uncharacterized protein LOC111043186 [Myzus persicae]
MDLYTQDIMKQWGFSTEIITIFKDQEIDQVALLNLTETMIIELLPIIGQRSKFLKHLEDLKIQKNVSVDSKKKHDIIDWDNLEIELAPMDSFEDVNSTDNIVCDTIPDNCNTAVQEFKDHCVPTAECSYTTTKNNDNSLAQQIQTILSKYQDGEFVLDYYKLKSHFNEAMRNKLVSVIIKDQIRSQVILNRSRLIILAKGIEELFPSETEETYFIPYCKEGNIISPNRGKLYGKFCNIKKEISKISNVKKRHLSESDQEINLNHEDYKDSLTWLKNNIEPDITLHKLWKATASYRLKDKNNNMMNTYIALTKPTGHILIDIDFNYMYAGKQMSLFDKFPIFKEKLKIYLEIKQINISKNLIGKLTAPHRPGMC